jgi:nucleoside-diphosphate-sugar epimerase
VSDRATPVFIIGHGDLGRRVAVRWLKRGAKVRALVRRPVTIAEPMHPRLERHRGDLDDLATLPVDAMSGTRLYYFAPPPASGVMDTRMRNLTEALRAPPAKTVLVSTTGVYGDCGVDWVGESRPPNPESDRARRRLDAEQLLEGYAKRHGMPLAILRVAGIYGPDRLPEKRLREQAPMPAADDCGYTNRIHIEDLVEVCVEVMARPAVTGLFNVSDGSPGTLREYFDLAADALGLPRLPVLPRDRMEATLSPQMLSYLTESRRIRNDKLLKTLTISLRYPDLKSGLANVSKSRTGK